MIAGPSEQDDDWMIRSMTRYDNLYMFELPQPTRCIEWSRNGTAICVAGFSTEASVEITQLALPGKLLTAQQETHWAKRDFQLINGALSSSPITALKYLGSTDTLATSGGQPSITLWTTDQQDSDCLKESGQVSLSLPSSLSSSHPLTNTHTFVDAASDSTATILAALSASLATVQELDLATDKCVFALDETDLMKRVHGVAYIPMATNLIVSCSGEKGEINIWDTRVSGGKAHSSEAALATQDSRIFGFALSSQSHPHTKVATLSAASDTVQLYDIRQCGDVYASCQLEGADSVRDWFKKTSRIPCIKFSETNSSLVSVSGCGRGVSVYDSSRWTASKEVAAPIFTHIGHEEDSPTAQVLTHSWQPNTDSSVLLSADSDGSLHAWQWKCS